MSSPNLLIFGGPNSGKTHYAGQLVGRLKRSSNYFKVRVGEGLSSELTALTQVLTRLEEGNSADHTPTGDYSEVFLPLEGENGSKLDLSWPDYGGEQVSSLFSRREVPSEWKERIENAHGWFLFIRLSAETTYPDALKELTSIRVESSSVLQQRPDIWDANAYYIELIQMLCHVGNLNLVSKKDKPALAIALSCYDEICDDKFTPNEMLAQKLPLFSAFIKNVWPEDKLSVWGVSPLGKELKPDSYDDDFIDEGPENQGWIVESNSISKQDDLTAPLSWILSKL